MLTLRPATRSDIDAVDRLLARSYGPLLSADYPPSVLVTALPRMARAQPRLLASGRYFVALLDDRVVGAGGWSHEPPGPGALEAGTGHVRHVATDARQVRQGVGRAVLRAIEDQARGEGVRRLACLSTKTAEPFYAALGFRRLGPVTLSFGGVDFPAVGMMRDL
jgi:GNAT superfamily N-acetyltransferase